MSNNSWPDWAIEILRCPITKTAVKEAEPETLAHLLAVQQSGKLTNCGGDTVSETFDAGLLSEDGRYFYPAYDSIPALMNSEAIDLQNLEG